jgi:outer membrane protein assembly factor BamA
MFLRGFLISLLLAATICSSAISVEVEFQNRIPENAKQLKEVIAAVSDPSFALLDSLASDLVNRGYLDAAIEIKSGKLIIRSGIKFIVSQLRLRTDSVRQIDVNIPFDSANVKKAINVQLQKFRDKGYLYVSAETKQISVRDSLVTIEFDINKGPLVEVGEPVYAGLKRTDPQIVSKYVVISSGETITPEIIKQAETAAESVPFLVFKPPVQLSPQPGYAVSDLLFNFLEQTPVRFEGAAGFAGEDNSTGVWSVDLALNNLFGSGRQVEIAADKREAGRSLLKVQYAQPSFLIGTGELRFAIMTRNYSDEFYEFDLSGAFLTKLNNRFSTRVKLGWKSVVPENGSLSYKSLSGQFALSRRSYTKNFNPLNGLAIDWAIDFSFREYTADNLPETVVNRSFNETRNNISVAYFQKLGGPLIWHSRFNYRGLETKEELPPLSELILLGGPGTLRGYRNEQFAVIRTVYGSIEPRIRFSSGFGFVFYDAAYLNSRSPGQSAEIITAEEFKWSYGLGFGIGNNHRSVMLSFGWNLEAALDAPRLSLELSSDI